MTQQKDPIFFTSADRSINKPNPAVPSSIEVSQVGFRIFLAVCVSIIACLQLWHYVSWSAEQLTAVGLIIDDAFFYSTIARNFHDLSVLTLDGTLTTNGVQPLWMLIQIGLVGLFPLADGLTLIMWASWICYILFCFLTIWYVARGPWLSMALASTAVTALLLNSQFQRLVFKGLETPLMLLMVIITLHIIDWVARRQAKYGAQSQWWLAIPLAITISLCFLARTDLFWMVLVVGAWYILRSKRPVISGTNLLFAGTVAAIIVPYLIFNWSTQGSLMPISGAVKLHYMEQFYTTWPDYFASDEWQGLLIAFSHMLPLPSQITFILAYPAIIIGTYAVWHFQNSLRFPPSIRLMTLAALAHIFMMQFVYREIRGYTSYYFAFELLWFTLVGGLLIVQWSNTPVNAGGKNKPFIRRVLPIAATILALVLVLYQWQTYHVQLSDYWVTRVSIAKDIRQIVPESERVGAFWPGTLSYFSQRNIVPLDGIVSSRDYFESYVVTGNEFGYLQENNITYLVIFLEDSLWQLMNLESEPEITHWSKLGVQRLWEQRATTSIEIITVRKLSNSDGGWYLLKLDYTSAETTPTPSAQ